MHSSSWSNWTADFSSDRVLACTISLAFFCVSLYLLNLASIRELWATIHAMIHGSRTNPSRAVSSYFSLPRAAISYNQYLQLSRDEIATMRSSYARISWRHKHMGYDLGYPEKLKRLEAAIDVNANVTQAIANIAYGELARTREAPSSWAAFPADLGRVREALKHFVRDWSDEGAEERGRIFGPILEVLSRVSEDMRRPKQVLVPGSGLCRLAWEISGLGFETTANELSSYMTSAFRFLLSEEKTPKPNEHTIQPYASWFSHQRENGALFREVHFPDVVPRASERLHLAECNFLSLLLPDSRITEEPPGYDFIVTLFFIDTSLNVIETLEHIHYLLKPGGAWINLGPLLWTGGGQAALELSLEEVIRLAKMIGFSFQDGGPASRRTVACEYTADRQAMMKWVYQAEFWVATKAQ